MSDVAVGTFRKNYIAAFGGGVSKDPIYASVVDGIRPQGIEHYLPLFYSNLETVFDYAGADTLIAFDGLLDEARTERWDLIEDFHSSRQEYVDARDTGSVKNSRRLQAASK
jgi:transcription-repair coupling factor (superfamily II helicase)